MRGSCRGLDGKRAQLSQGHLWVWLAGPGGKKKILGLEGSWPLRRDPIHSPECRPRGAHSFLAGKLQEKASWACLSPGPAGLGSLQTPCRHQGGHRCWKAKEKPEGWGKARGEPSTTTLYFPGGQGRLPQSQGGGKAEQDPPLKLSGQSKASRM